MKKQTLLITTLIFAIALSACGGGEAPLPATEPAATTEAVSQPTETPVSTETSVPATEAPTATEASATDSSTAAGVSFAADIKPILDARCIKCHGVEQTKEGLDLQTYENIFAGSRNGSVIEPGNATESLFVQLIVEGEMPSRGQAVTPEELQLIIEWVNQGALNN